MAGTRGREAASGGGQEKERMRGGREGRLGTSDGDGRIDGRDGSDSGDDGRDKVDNGGGKDYCYYDDDDERGGVFIALGFASVM